MCWLTTGNTAPWEVVALTNASRKTALEQYGVASQGCEATVENPLTTKISTDTSPATVNKATVIQFTFVEATMWLLHKTVKSVIATERLFLVYRSINQFVVS